MDDAERRLGKYLTQGESIVVATHRHWFAIAEPLATTTLSLIFIGFAVAAGAPTSLLQLLQIAWLVVFGRAVVRIWEWNLEWFVATDHRLLLIYGFIIRKVDMLPMTKVTDMTFRRSILGRLFGYGTFVLESAGQDQALSDLEYIPNPNDTYLKIVGTIFKTGPGDDDVSPEDFEESTDPLVEEKRLQHEAYDPWEEEDPTERPSLRADLARLGRRRQRDRRDDSPDTVSFSRASGTEGPVADHERRRQLKRKRHGDYTETLYSSLGSRHMDPWDEEEHGPHRKRGHRWGS